MPPRPLEDDPHCARCGARLLSRAAAEANCPNCALDAALAVDADAGADANEDWLDALGPAAGDTRPRVAERVFGRYELLNEIGRGGMGVVYRARQQSPARVVALKVMLPQSTAAPQLLARFRAEAEAISSLDHPHILPVFEAGERDGLPYFSMKFAEGGSLSHRLPQYSGLYREAARLVAAIAHGVDHAHRRGILHRDLKPANILLDLEGTPFVADFGIAKLLGKDIGATLTGVALGTPAYMAPEQALGRSSDLTVAADIYSLGAILYEMLAQHPPFSADTAVEMLRRVVDRTPRPLTEAQPEIPRDLETICLKCLAKDPSHRYATAEALAEDLERWLDGRPVQARPVGVAGQAWRWARRNPALAAALTAVLVLLLALGIGSSFAALSIQRERRAAEADRDRAVRAEAEGRIKLREALVARAEVHVRETRAGRRDNALEAIRGAAALQPTFALRQLAIAALALPELRRGREWNPRSENPARHIVFDPNGEYYALEGPTGGVEIRTLADDALKLHFETAGLRLGAGLLSRQAHSFAARLSDRSLRVWDCATGRELLRLDERPAAENQISASPDFAFTSDETGLLAAAPGGGVTWHRLSDGAPVATWSSVTRVATLAIAPRGDLIAVAHYGTPRLTILASHDNTLTTFRDVEQSDRISTLSWSNDGSRLLAGSIVGGVIMLDAATDRRLLAVAAGRGLVFNAFFSHDDRWFFTAAANGGVRVWDTSRGLLASQLTVNIAEPSLTLDRAGTRLAGTSINSGIWLAEWLPSPVAWSTSGPPLGERPGVFGAIDFSPDGHRLAAVAFPTLRVFDVAPGREILRVPGDAKDETSAYFEADGRHLLVSSRRHGLRRVEVPDDNALESAPLALDAEPDFLLVDYVRDRQLAVLSNYRSRGVKVLALNGGASPREIFRGEGPSGVWAAALSPDGRTLIAQPTAHGDVQNAISLVWDISTRTQTGTLLIGHSGTIVWTHEPEPRLLVAGTVLTGLMDFRTGAHVELPETVRERDGGFFASARDGKTALLGVRGGMMIVRLPQPEFVADLPAAPGDVGVEPVAFSADGRYAARLATDGSVHVWDLAALRSELRSLGLDW